MKEISFRFTIGDSELAERLREHTRKRWNNQRGAMSMIIRLAIKEYLDRYDERERAVSVGQVEEKVER